MKINRHYNESDCAIPSAVESGDIHSERYRSYVILKIGNYRILRR